MDVPRYHRHLSTHSPVPSALGTNNMKARLSIFDDVVGERFGLPSALAIAM
jgi:hypothetical protein